MTDIINTISGAKTYIIAVVAIAAIILNHFWVQPWLNLDPNNWIMDIWAWIIVITGRSALAQHAAQVTAGVKEGAKEGVQEAVTNIPTVS